MGTIKKHIKLRLHEGFDDDVIEIMRCIAPGRLAGTIIQLLRLYPQLSSQMWQLQQGAPMPHIAPKAEHSTAAIQPTALTVPVTKPAVRVALNTGFDALDDDG